MLDPRPKTAKLRVFCDINCFDPAGFQDPISVPAGPPGILIIRLPTTLLKKKYLHFCTYCYTFARKTQTMNVLTDKTPLIEAVRRAVEVVLASYGPRPQNVTFCGEGVTINDGVRIIEKIPIPSDPLMAEGILRLKRACQATHRSAGDGTSTTALFFRYWLESLENACASSDRMQTISEARGDLARLLSEIEALKAPVTKEEDLVNVVKTAMHGHSWAEPLAKLLFELGKDGVFSIEASNEVKTETKNAMTWGAGLVGGNLTTNLEIEDAFLAVISGELTQMSEIEGVMGYYGQHLKAGGIRPLVIVAQGFGPSIKRSLLNPEFQGIGRVPIFLLAAPQVKEQYHLMGDLAEAAGGVLFDKHGKHDPKQRTNDGQYGRVMRLVVKGGASAFTFHNMEKAKNYASTLIQSADRASDPEERESIQMRASNVMGKIGVMKIPISTESEMIHMKEVLEDGYRTAQEAMREGVLPGKGKAVYQAVAKAGDAFKHQGMIDGLYATQADALGVNESDKSAVVIDSFQAVKNSLLNSFEEAALIVSTKFFIH
jgi:chaperonin GroEL